MTPENITKGGTTNGISNLGAEGKMRIFAILFLLTFLAAGIVGQGMKGRVVGYRWIDNIIEWQNADFPNEQILVIQTGLDIRPQYLKIVYRYFKKTPLTESVLMVGPKIGFHAKRDRSCDEEFSVLDRTPPGFNMDAAAVTRVPKGSSLPIGPNEILKCYVVREGRLRLLSEKLD